MNKLRSLNRFTLGFSAVGRCREIFVSMTPMINGTKQRSHKYAEPVETFVDVGGVSTHLVKLGQLGNQNGENQRFLILIVPGNPGVPTFYEDFMMELYNQSGGKIPVWAVGHAGHTRPPDKTLSLRDVFATDEKKYGLEGQIDHKATFIKEYVPPDVKVILIGHSIGCYFILNVLDKLPVHHVQRCFLLFPTIERMAISPNGLNLTPVFRYLRWLIVLCAFFCILLPITVRQMIVRYIYRDIAYPSCMTSSILTTVTPWTVNFSTFLAKTEMNKVTTLQKDMVRRHLDKLSFYYGASDLWCPMEYYKDMVNEFPTIDAHLCELDMKHAFVMVEQEGLKMAEIIWQWLHVCHLPKSFADEIRSKETNGVHH